MARNKTATSPKKPINETEITEEEIKENSASLVASMQEEFDPEREAKLAEVPKAKKYRAMNSGWVMLNGFKSAVRPGKVFDSANFNIDLVASQGIQLQEIELTANRKGNPSGIFYSRRESQD